MRLAALTNVADDSRTMLCDGLTTRCANTASSHQGTTRSSRRRRSLFTAPMFPRDRRARARASNALCSKKPCEGALHGNSARWWEVASKHRGHRDTENTEAIADFVLASKRLHGPSQGFDTSARTEGGSSVCTGQKTECRLLFISASTPHRAQTA